MKPARVYLSIFRYCQTPLKDVDSRRVKPQRNVKRIFSRQIKVVKYRGLLKVKANWHTCIMEKYGQYDWQPYWTGLMWVGWQYQGADCSSGRLFSGRRRIYSSLFELGLTYSSTDGHVWMLSLEGSDNLLREWRLGHLWFYTSWRACSQYDEDQVGAN